MRKRHRRGKPRRGVSAAAEIQEVARWPEHLAVRDDEDLAARIRRVTAVRDEQRAVAGHQEVLAAGRAQRKDEGRG